MTFEGLTSRFNLRGRGEELGGVTLNLPGMHNVYNALASIVVGSELGIPFDSIRSALKTVGGVRRRIEIKGKAAGAVIVDDYGHHPTEIKTTLQAVQGIWPHGRKVVVFQPHRYTRTQALFEEFTRAFYQSDILLVLPIYAASEAPIEGIEVSRLCEGIAAHGHKHVECVADLDGAVARIEEIIEPGDVLLTLGAGDVYRVGERVLERLAER